MITKQGIDVSFAQGLDTKTDPKRLQIGKFTKLNNSVFTKGGQLTKRNGYGSIASLPSSGYQTLTTLKGNLTAVGPDIAAYDQDNDSWVSRGSIIPLSLSVLPAVRNPIPQVQCDAVMAPNGLVCTAYTEANAGSLSYKFAIMRGDTGQNIFLPFTLAGSVSGSPIAAAGSPRVFCMGNYFVIAFTVDDSGTYYLQYLYINSVNLNDNNLGFADTIAANYTPADTVAWDGVVVGNALYVAYNTQSPAQAVEVVKILPGFTLQGPHRFTGNIGTIFTVTSDTSGTFPIIWISFYDAAGSTGYSCAVGTSLSPVLLPTEIISSGAYANLASVATAGKVTILAELSQNYGFTSNVASNEIITVSVSQIGTVSFPFVACRGLGLASKAFYTTTGTNSVRITFLAAYNSPYQASYFMMGMISPDDFAQPVSRLAYQNGGGYLFTGLPSALVTNNQVLVAYLFQDLIEAANKGTNETTTPVNPVQRGGIYSQTGVNLATFNFSPATIDTTELGSNLNMSGGFLWMYDGYVPVEQNFLLYPDIVPINDTDANANWAVPHTSGGHMDDQVYYYQMTYEWTDNQGNAFRSAPSIPIKATISGGSGSGHVTLNIPTLRVTYKGGVFSGSSTDCKIVVYRWSAGQQEYYQTTSITAPTLNNTGADYVTIQDINADATILGNNLIYTTGGVIEDIAPPATDLTTIFDNRLWLVDAEDPNLLWYSKQVIEATPVEMSDLFTVYVSPTISAIGPTGPIQALGTLDDKLIIAKANALYYINGNGPDNTGANSQFSEPILISSSVGCSNQQSMVIMQIGLMFQSNKGIWLLGRDLSTSYIGAPVEVFNADPVTSAINVPGTNQVRFTLTSGTILVYDYYYGQWSTFSGLQPIASCIYEQQHSLIDASGRAYIETPNLYLDGSLPVVMSFTTGPLRLGDLQNYQRAFFFYLLGEFLSPHKLHISVAYDYGTTAESSVVITPINYSTPFGSVASQSPFGQGNPFGGPSSLENWRVFLSKQRCQAFSITLQEIFDASFGTAAGAGLTLSGLNVVCGFKKAFRPQAAVTSAGLS